ncbi:MAG: hypothetical protein ACKOCK_09715 [Chloroflexota bacterium]
MKQINAPIESESYRAPTEGWAPDINTWALVVAITAAKIGTIVVILVYAWRAETGGWVALLNWHFFLLIGLLVAGPVAYYRRLRRVRARRALLIRQEWLS